MYLSDSAVVAISSIFTTSAVVAISSTFTTSATKTTITGNTADTATT